MVVQFVGFLSSYRHPGALPPMLAGTLGGLLATWCTFVPCFLWIGLGAPFIERLRNNNPLNGALAGITAAVVGVILNLAIWFALHTWFREAIRIGRLGLSFDLPVLASADLWALGPLSVAAMVAMFRFNVGAIPTLLARSAEAFSFSSLEWSGEQEDAIFTAAAVALVVLPLASEAQMNQPVQIDLSKAEPGLEPEDLPFGAPARAKRRDGRLSRMPAPVRDGRSPKSAPTAPNTGSRWQSTSRSAA
jgi:Chromate transporter